MAKKTTLAELGKLLKSDDKKGDTSFWGVVKSVNTDSEGKVTSYNVSLGGESGTVKCRKLTGAKVNDTVLVTLRSTGEAVVVGTKNGDTDISDVATDLDENYSTTEEVEEMIAEAGSGNAIYYQTSAPTGGTYKTGDTWFDTDNGYAIYRWTGSQWLKSELDSDALAAGCVIASKIEGGAVTADKIGANAVTIGKLGSDVTDEIDDAATTATAYITADGTGIKVRDSQSSTSYVHVGSSAVDIYSSGNKVASLSSGGIVISPDPDDAVAPNIDFDSQDCTLYAQTLNLEGGRVVYIDSAGGTGTIGMDGAVEVSGSVTATQDVNATRVKVTTTATTSTHAGRTSEGYLRAYSGSSRRFKENIEDLSDEQKQNLRKLYDVDVKSWNYKDNYIDESDDFYGKTIFGVIAEDLIDAVPETSEADADGVLCNYKDRLLLNAILFLVQEQHAEIESLKERVTALET